MPCLLQLHQLGANINACDLQGQSALHAAAKLSDPVPCIHFLLRSGIDAKLTNVQGLTAMQVALAIMNIPALEALGGRHLEVEATGVQSLDMNSSVYSDSMIESSIGQHSAAGMPLNASRGSRGQERVAGKLQNNTSASTKLLRTSNSRN